MILFGFVPESDRLSPWSVVATARQMAKRSRPFTDEASKHTGASSQSKPVGKRVLALAAVRQEKSSPLISAQEKTQPDVKGQENPSQASGDRLQSKEEDDMRNLLPAEVKRGPYLVKRIEEALKKTFGTLKLTNFPVNTATWCIFARDCMWATFRMRGCQNYSCSNTQAILNRITESLLENDQDGEPSVVHGRGK